MSVEIPFDEPIPIISVDQLGEHEFDRHHFMRLPDEDCMENLPKPKFSVVDGYKPSPMPVFPPPYIQFKAECNENLFATVDYEMDEEDMAWLEARNVSRQEVGLQPVSEEDFELLLDRFEKESFLYMKATGKLEVPEGDDDAICHVCSEGDCVDTNLILFCDLCNLPIHQDCYGVPYVPEGQWLCRKCFLSPSEDVYCVMCPNTGGAFKQTDRGHWAHILCALWVPGVRFGNSQFMEPIEGIENIPTANLKANCYLCKIKNVGATIHCQERNCKLSFHVTCAQLEGLHMKFLPNGTIVEKEAFCSNHSLDAAKPKIITNQERKFDVPTMPLEKIQEIGQLVSFDSKGRFVLRLIAYWKLKRLFRSCVPLLRRLQIPPAISAINENFNQLLVKLHQNRYFNSSLKLLERFCNWEREQRSMRQNSCFALTSYDEFVARCSHNLDLSPGNFDYVIKKLNKLMELAKCIDNFETRAKRIQIVDILIRRVNESKPDFLPRAPISSAEDLEAQEDHKSSSAVEFNAPLQETNSPTGAVPSVGDDNQKKSNSKLSSVASHNLSADITDHISAPGNPSPENVDPSNGDCSKCLSEVENVCHTVLPEPLHTTCVLTKNHSIPLAIDQETQKLNASPAKSTQLDALMPFMSSGSKMASDSQQKDLREEAVEGNESDSWEELHDQSNQFNAFDVVWAKCQGYPWYPAMIINPKIPERFSINGISIPNPPQDVVAFAVNQPGLVHLVCYYDRKRSWEWLPVSKLRQLGHGETDKRMLAFSKQTFKKRDVRKAYYKARRHQSLLNSVC